MNSLLNLGRLAVSHTRSAVAESLYLKGLGDVTRPTVIYGIVNERCNYKCRYCEYWRLPKYQDEMTIDEWKKSLQSLHEFTGTFHVEFSGGEPFLRKDIIELFEFCDRIGLQWGVTTNGSAFSDKMVRRIVAARPFNINVSMDSHLAEIHNYARGIDGSLERITRGIQLLIQERDRVGLEFPVMIKPVVHKLNFRHLPQMVDWVRRIGGSVINFQPVDRWTQETYDELWIEEDEMDELREVVDRLREMKQQGAPILNSDLTLSVWPAHFREEKAPPETMPCRVGLRNYFIRTNGDVEVCWHYPPIGNVKRQTAREIWGSQEARDRRRETVACERLCLFTCLSQKTLQDRFRMGLTLLSGRNNNGGDT